MTEDQAKTKVCCGPWTIASVGAAPHIIANKEKPPVSTGACLGSACMAWRWKKVANPKWNSHQSYMAQSPMPNPYTQEPTGIDSTTDGYCGLAGQP